MKASVHSADKAERRALALRNSIGSFEALPDSARVRIPVALALTGCGRASFYDKSSRGLCPPIEKLAGGRASGVRVGELRRFLKDSSQYVAAVAA